MTPPWRFASGAIALDRPRLIAIINTTPDSFSDGGECLDPPRTLERIRAALDEGADAIDIGGESTRPGALPVPPDEQIRRTVPVIAAARAAGVRAPISIDTTSAAVARAALDAGADIINDTSGGRDDPAMLPLAAHRRAGLILMHRLHPPRADSYSHQYAAPPDYDASLGGVVGVVRRFLNERADAAMSAGVPRDSIVLDPGLGFGKSVDQNFELIRSFADLAPLGFPLLSAASRKSFLGAATGIANPKDRVAASVAVSVAHALMGVRLFRVHDVRPHAEALRAAHAIALPPR